MSRRALADTRILQSHALIISFAILALDARILLPFLFGPPWYESH